MNHAGDLYTSHHSVVNDRLIIETPQRNPMCTQPPKKLPCLLRSAWEPIGGQEIVFSEPACRNQYRFGSAPMAIVVCSGSLRSGLGGCCLIQHIQLPLRWESVLLLCVCVCVCVCTCTQCACLSFLFLVLAVVAAFVEMLLLIVLIMVLTGTFILLLPYYNCNIYISCFVVSAMFFDKLLSSWVYFVWLFS